MSDHEGDSQAIKLKAKIKTCDDEDLGHELSATFDKYIKKKGGQTSLDASMGDEGK